MNLLYIRFKCKNLHQIDLFMKSIIKQLSSSASLTLNIYATAQITSCIIKVKIQHTSDDDLSLSTWKAELGSFPGEFHV